MTHGGHGALVVQRRGRGHGGVQKSAGIVTMLSEQQEVVKHSGSLRAFVVTVRVIAVVHGGDRAQASCSWCLAGSWR